MQKNINFGSFPDDPSADAIRTAFNKTQQNFTEVYAGIKQAGVLTVNKTAGTGITVNSTTGNVVISANISNVNVRTGSLSIGIGANGAETASLVRSSQTLWIDLRETSTTGNLILSGYANVAGNITAGNINVLNSAPVVKVEGNSTAQDTGGKIIITNGATTGKRGAAIGSYVKDIGGANAYVAIEGLYANNDYEKTLAQYNLTDDYWDFSTAGTVRLTINPNGAMAFASAYGNAGEMLTTNGVGSAPTWTIPTSLVNGNSNVILSANSNVTIGVAGNSAMFTVTGTGANVAGYANVSGNITGANASLGNLAEATYLSGTLIIGSNAQPNITSVGTLSSLTVSGIFSSSGSENLANLGAVNLSLTTSYFATGGAETATLGAGTPGQIKTFVMTGDSGDMTITVTNAGWGVAGTMTFNAVGDGCTLQYINSKWYCIGNNSVVFA